MKRKLIFLLVIALSIILNSSFLFYRDIIFTEELYYIFAFNSIVYIAYWVSLTKYTIGLGNRKKISYLFLLPLLSIILLTIRAAHLSSVASPTVYFIIKNIYYLVTYLLVIIPSILNYKESRDKIIAIILMFALIKLLRVLLLSAGLTISIDYYLANVIRDILIFALLIVEILKYIISNKYNDFSN